MHYFPSPLGEGLGAGVSQELPLVVLGYHLTLILSPKGERKCFLKPLLVFQLPLDGVVVAGTRDAEEIASFIA